MISKPLAILFALVPASAMAQNTWSCAAYCGSAYEAVETKRYDQVVTGEGQTMAEAFKNLAAQCSNGTLVGGAPIGWDLRPDIVVVESLATPRESCLKN